MKGERLIVLAVCILLALPVIAHATFSTELVTVQESVLPGESARFELYITNELATEDRYIINSEQFSYILSLDPHPGSVPAGETALYGLEVTPRSSVNFGSYRAPIRIRSQTSGAVEEIMPIIRVRDPDRVGATYTPSIALSVGIPDAIDPREDVVITVGLRNRNARVYDVNDPLTILIDGEVFSRQYTTSLGGVTEQGEKTSEVRVEVDSFLPPGEHSLNVQVLVDNVTVSEQQVQYRIIGYVDIVQDTEVEGRFFSTTTTYTLTNMGNAASEADIAYPSSALQRLFISTSQEYDVQDVNGEQHIVITEMLDPQQSVTVSVTENYRLLVVLIFLVILSIIGYLLLRSPIVLGKEAGLAGTPHDGVSEIKVRVFVRNRTSKTMRNLRVVDRISGMADIIKEESLGTLKPTKISKKKDQGTLIRWDIDQLEPFEERIISYRAKTPLKLVGDVTLPAVKVKYDLPSGRERTSHSNEVSMAKGE